MSNKQEFIFVWQIQNFSCDFYACGDSIESPIFEAKNFGGSRWCLRLYPRGEIEDSKGMFSVYLYKKKNGLYSDDSNVSCEFELTGDNTASPWRAKTDTTICKVNERVGFRLFLYTATVSNGLKKWPRNSLIARCHMFNTCEQKYSHDVEVHSEIPVNQISFLWTVNVSDISSKSVVKNIIFTGNPSYEMTMSMPEDVIRICLTQKGDYKLPSFVEIKLSLVKPNGNVSKSERFTHLFKTDDESQKWDFSTLITKIELNCHSECSGNFSLFFEIAASTGIQPVVTNSGCTTMEVGGTVLKDLKNMLHNRIHSDIKLKVGNEELLVHKSILAVRSPVFSAMFDQDMIESQTGVINIPDFEADIVKLFLEFLYTDSCENFNYEKAKKLIVIADKYQVSPLIEKCAAILESVLSLENAFDILSLSDIIGHKCLKKAVLNFIATNSKILLNAPGWKDLLQENVKLVGEIISNIASNLKIAPNN